MFGGYRDKLPKVNPWEEGVKKLANPEEEGQVVWKQLRERQQGAGNRPWVLCRGSLSQNLNKAWAWVPLPATVGVAL